MLVDYDDSSDEEPKPQKDLKKPVQAPSKSQPTTTIPPKKKVMLPSVTGLLSKIPDSHLLGAKEEEPENVKRPSLKTESYNNVRPPSFSLTQEKDMQDAVEAKFKRRRVVNEEDEDEDREMQKHVKSEKPQKIIDVEKVKENEKTQRLVPTQVKTKKANIPTLF
jgi:hypothetical protein